MALIICPDCGGKVSDKAEACIHCGCPLKSNTSELKRLSDSVSQLMNTSQRDKNNILDLKFPIGWYLK